MKLQKILVGTDFSKESTKAIKAAAQVASKFNAELNIIHVCDNFQEDALPFKLGTVLEGGKTYEEFIKDHLQNILNAQLNTAELSDVKITEHICFGNPKTKMLDHLKKNSYDLLVVASHGHNYLEELLLGSVTEKMLRVSPIPVLVVKGEDRNLFEDVIVSLGLDEVDIRTLDFCKGLQSNLDRPLTFAHVVEPNPELYFHGSELKKLAAYKSIAEFLEHEKDVASTKINEYMKNYSFEGQLKLEVFNNYDTAYNFVNMCAGSPSLLVTGSHKRGMIGNMFIGSVASKIVSLSKTSVLVIK